MFGSLFGKVAWVGRATIFCVGLAVVLAVVLGAGTTALAAMPGDPFKLGRFNQVDRMSALVGDVSGALLVVDNRGQGAALDLRVGDRTSSPSAKAVAPMRVDSQAKVANLNADELDGKGAEAFQPAGSKAADSERLDGKDSYDFMRYFSRYVIERTAEDSRDKKTVVASCPEGEVALSGQAAIGTERAVIETTEIPAALQAVGRGGGRGWMAVARETEDYDQGWHLTVTAYCVQTPPDIVPAGG